MITAQQVRELLDYDPITGIFTWRLRPVFQPQDISWNTYHAGRPAGCISKKLGYVLIGIWRRRYWAHRLAWLHYYAEWPTGTIDHIDGNGLNNRIVNLRDAAHADNICNAKRSKRNTSGVKGISPIKGGKWLARFSYLGIIYHVGYFDNIDDAIEPLQAMRAKVHGEYANHG